MVQVWQGMQFDLDRFLHPSLPDVFTLELKRDVIGNLLPINDLGHGGSDHPLNSMRTCFFSFTLFFEPSPQPS